MKKSDCTRKDITQAALQLYRRIQDEMKASYKYLLVYRNRQEMSGHLNDKIYSICDADGKPLCDVFEEDYKELMDELKVIDTGSVTPGISYASDWVISEPIYRPEVLSRRAVILFTEWDVPPTKRLEKVLNNK